MCLLSRRVLLTVTAFAITASAAYAGYPSSGQLEQVTVRKMGTKSETSTQKIKWSGAKFRLEGQTGKQKFIQIGDGKKVYSYDPAKKSATSAPMAKDMKPSNFIAEQAASAKTAAKMGKKVGSERVGTCNCDVYTLSHPMTQGKSVTRKIWINKDPNFPVQVKSVTSMGDRSITSTFKNIKLGAKIPDSLFALPKGTKVSEHPSVPVNPHKPGGAPIPKKK